MDKQNLSAKINELYNKLNLNGHFNDIKLSNNQNTIFNNKNKTFHNKFMIKLKEKNIFPNKSLYGKNSLCNIDKDKYKDNKYINNEKILINLKKDINDNKENQTKSNHHKFHYNKSKKIRCCSQEQRNMSIVPSPPKINTWMNKEGDDEKCNDNIDINLFFDKINKEFNDMGKLIKINFVIDDKTIYNFIKNEYIILKIIENELREKYGLKIKEFIYKNQTLNFYKSLKENNLEDNCFIKIIIDN